MSKAEGIKKIIGEDAYNKVASFLGFSNEKFLDVKASDGSIFKVTGEELQVDAKVELVNEDGSLTEVADGEYVLEDGTKIIVVASMITEVVAAEDMTEEKTEDSKEAVNVELSSQLLELSKVVEAQKNEIDSLRKSVNESKEVVSEIFKVVEKISEAPSVAATSVKKNAFKLEEKIDYASELAKRIQKLKNNK